MPGCTVIPVLAYPDVGEAVEWLCNAFGFTMRIRVANHRAQLNVGDGAVVLTKQSAIDGQPSHSIMVRVENVDRHHQNARRNGAHIVSPPANFPYGERQYSVEDFAGHHWTFSQSVADVEPEQWGGTTGTI